MTLLRRGAVAGCAALLAVAACGEGPDVHLGSVTPHGDAGAASNPSDCDAGPCAEHHGTRVFVEPSAAGTSPNAFTQGTEVPPGTEPDSEPALLYPSDETRLPVNFSHLRCAWLPGRSALFALDFVGPNTTVRIVTADSSFSPTDEEWQWIATANRGATLEVTLRGLDGAVVRRARSQRLSVSQFPLEGTVYYWSTGAEGLMRARPTATEPERFLAKPAGTDAATCTGCHTISRDGQRVVAAYDKNQLAEFALGDRSVLVPPGSFGADAPAEPPDGGPPAPPDMMMPKADKLPPLLWSTFSPDAKLLLAAGGGKLRLLDSDTGAPIGPDQGAVPLPMGVLATHPDWSPLGDRIAVTLAGKGGDKQTEQGSIAVIPYAAGAFGDPEVLVPSAGDQDNNFFPSFSPDARFIAYVNARGGSQEARGAALRLVEVATKTVHELTRLNERVGADDGVLDIGNTMPTWCPVADDGSYWLAFSSLRAYSDVRAAHPKQDQLWIAGIDPSLDDPSFAAFWAPFQSVAQGNHRAFWVTSDPNAECGCLERCGNGRDDDCDGDVDEDDCSASCDPRETCGDGVDNDCDCVPDDCADEICDDGVDNDGDGKADKMDLTCAAK
ncbi:MAG TPA: hypothetical protein VGQ57_13990 [Polyangiaceae bacterium]|jgi:TolB protein|nr:hypothetical protein [Polyangiaceae bacterium]